MQFNFGGFGQDPNGGDYGFQPQREKKPRKPRKTLSRGKSLLIALAVTLIFGFLYFYFRLPAINIHSGDLYVFIILLCAVFGVCTLLLSGAQASGAREWVTTARKRAAVPFMSSASAWPWPSWARSSAGRCSARGITPPCCR